VRACAFNSPNVSTTQGVDFALALADRVYVLERCAVRHSGAASGLRDAKALLDKLLSV
jgi:branched-chain amino acid transport system ATP-binding protein